MEFILDKIGLLAGITVGGVSLLTIIGFVLWKVLTASFNRLLAKINVDGVVDKAVAKAVDRVKSVSFKHSIQPLVESGLEKINEKIDERLEKQLAEIKENQAKIVNIFEKFYDYFEDSMVSDDKKKAMKTAIEDAKQDSVEIESVVVEETHEVEEKAIVAPVEAVKTHTKVER